MSDNMEWGDDKTPLDSGEMNDKERHKTRDYRITQSYAAAKTNGEKAEKLGGLWKKMHAAFFFGIMLLLIWGGTTIGNVGTSTTELITGWGIIFMSFLWLGAVFYLKKKSVVVSSKARKSKTFYESIKGAYEREDAYDFEGAIRLWEKIGCHSDARRARIAMNKFLGTKVSQKIDQTLVQGDTIVKDSVVSKSNVGAGGKSKAEQIKEIKELLDSGAIDDAEFQQMKKEILGE